MIFKRIELKRVVVNSFAILPLCEECGSEMNNDSSVCYYVDSAQFEMICKKCHRKHMLYEKEMPRIGYEKIENEIIVKFGIEVTSTQK